MRTALFALSSILTIVAVLPYLRDVIKGTTKPRIVSWIIWTILMAIAGFASLAEGAVASSVLAFSAAFATLLIVIIGFNKSTKDMQFFEAMCLLGAIIGLLLWWRFNSPIIAIAASIIIDFIAAIPTLVHSWKKPYEETVAAFAISCVGAFCSLLAVQSISPGTVALPLYLVTINLVFTIVLIVRPKYVKADAK